MNTIFPHAIEDDEELLKKGIVPDGGMVRVSMVLMDSGQRAIAQHKQSRKLSDNGYAESVEALQYQAIQTHTEQSPDHGYSESVAALQHQPGGHKHTANQSPDNGYAESVAALQFNPGGNAA